MEQSCLSIKPENHTGVPEAPDPLEQFIWDCVSLKPLRSLWDFQGVPLMVIVRRTWKATWDDDLFGSAAELGYWFLFSLFPTLVTASVIVGLEARHASANYDRLLHYFSLVLPPSASGFVLQTFNEITANSNGSKLTFGLLLALWAASSGFSAIQDAMNIIYKVRQGRPYWKLRGMALLISPLLSLLITAIMAVLLTGNFLAHAVYRHIAHHDIAVAGALAMRAIGTLLAVGLLALLYSLIYYWAPDVKHRQWRWLTPGSAIAILGWLLVSLGWRLYLHFFNSYTTTYGSLGAVIILMTWFYLTGLMLLLGGEVNSEIEAAATEKRLKAIAETATM